MGMSRKVTYCQRCGIHMEPCDRVKVSVMREFESGRFTEDGFSRYLCKRCGHAFREDFGKWCS